MSNLFGDVDLGHENVNRGGARGVTFRVVGVPQPQGSLRAFTPRGWTRPIVTSDNPNLHQWRQLVAVTAGTVATGELFTGPVSLSLVFHLPRPKSAPRAVVFPAKRPDLDKLVRACQDALTRVLWVDDGQVVDLRATKRYAAAGEPTGVCVAVAEAK